jgi:MFS family permease
MLAIIENRLSPFRSRAFLQFFAAQSLSQIGNWSFDLARAWIVLHILGQASELGLVLLLSSLPMILLLHGGMLVDRIPFRRLLYLVVGAKAVLALLSIILACIIEFHTVELWHLIAFGVVQGFVAAFDAPAYMTISLRLVKPDDFQQAIALNSSNFHASRTLGPLVAGALMIFHGPSLVILFDGISFLALIFILFNIAKNENFRKLKTEAPRSTSPIRDGFKHVFLDSKRRYAMSQLLISIAFIIPLIIVVFRSYIEEQFKVTGAQFGHVFSYPALGSFLGAISFAVIKPKRPLKALFFGIPAFALATAAIPLFPDSLSATTLAMSISGYAAFFCFSAYTVSLHLEVNEHFRGRLTSFILFGFTFIGQIMCLPIGAMSDNFGAPKVFSELSLAYLIVATGLFLFHFRKRILVAIGISGS